MVSSAEIRDGLRRARVPKYSRVNVSDVLSKSGHYVDKSGERGSVSWQLTNSGTTYVTAKLGLPNATAEQQADEATLEAAVTQVSDDDVREYLEEGLKCFRVGARRASVVFLWTGAVRMLQSQMLRVGQQKLNMAIAKHDPKARNVSNIDHFAYIKDRILLLAAQELGILDKSEKDAMQEALDLRNRCGHPGKYRPGEKKVSSFIEDLMQVLLA